MDKFVESIKTIPPKMGVTALALQVIPIILKLFNRYLTFFFVRKLIGYRWSKKKFDILKSRRGKPLKLNI